MNNNDVQASDVFRNFTLHCPTQARLFDAFAESARSRGVSLTGIHPATMRRLRSRLFRRYSDVSCQAAVCIVAVDSA